MLKKLINKLSKKQEDLAYTIYREAVANVLDGYDTIQAQEVMRSCNMDELKDLSNQVRRLMGEV